jgi:hypothetical protein
LLLWGFYAWRYGNWPVAGLIAAVFYATMAVLALPLLLVLRFTNRSNAFTCTMTGVLFATVLIAAFIAITTGVTEGANSGYVDNALSTVVFLQIALFAALGGATGATFWMVAPAPIVEDRSQERLRASSR